MEFGCRCPPGNLAGYGLDLFEQFRWYDDVIHAFTSFAWTLLLVLFLYDAVLKGAKAHPVLYVLMVASIGIGLGAVWEIIEWSYDRMIPGNVILGKTDTILDLILDFLGATLAAIVSLRMIQEK